MDKPFIKLFHTPNSGYFLDVNKNELIQISEPSFWYLNAVLTEHFNPEIPMPQELVELKDNGYLSTESNVKEVRHRLLDNLDIFLERKISKITLQLTQQCNFRCKYCIYDTKSSVLQRGHSNKSMDWITAKKAIDFLWDHSVDSQRINVGFYGGEPLLQFPLIQKAVEYSKNLFRGKDLSFTITTNGTLLNDEIIMYFQENDVITLISLDGPKDVNDRNRVFADGTGTYDTVVDSIKRIRQIAPEYAKKLKISMVIDPENDFDCINSVFLDENDLRKLNLRSSFIDRSYDDETISISESYSWKSEYERFLSFLSYYGRFPKEAVSPIIDRQLDMVNEDFSNIENGVGLFQIDAPSGPCVPGQNRLFVDISGKLFPCERVSETSSVMCIGTLDAGFDMHNLYSILNIGHLTEVECKKCWCFRHCTMCATKADDGSPCLSKGRKLSYCNETKSFAYQKISRHLFFKEVPIFYQHQTRGKVRMEDIQYEDSSGTVSILL